MKKIYSFLLLFCGLTISVFGQTISELLLTKSWYLTDFRNECFGTSISEEPIPISFYEKDNDVFYESKMCQSVHGKVTFDEPNIIFSLEDKEGDTCAGYLEYYYEVGFQCALSTDYQYEIIEKDNGCTEIIMGNDIFMSAILSTCTLATDSVHKNQITISPNPVKDFVTISNFPQNKKVFVQLLDASGKLLRNERITSEKIDLSFLAKGVYVLKIYNDSEMLLHQKIIKQ